MNDNHLISVAEFKQLARPASVHIDESEVLAYIREAEDINIKPAIGITLFDKLADAVSDSDLNADELILFKGGTYNDDCDKAKECAGLKRAVAYLAYARMIAANGGMVTRTGYYQHDDDYASRVDDKNRANARRDVQNMADYYLGSCIEYYAMMMDGCCKRASHRGGNVRIKSIGHYTE